MQNAVYLNYTPPTGAYYSYPGQPTCVNRANIEGYPSLLQNKKQGKQDMILSAAASFIPCLFPMWVSGLAAKPLPYRFTMDLQAPLVSSTWWKLGN